MYTLRSGSERRYSYMRTRISGGREKKVAAVEDGGIGGPGRRRDETVWRSIIWGIEKAIIRYTEDEKRWTDG
jgi:hypothetical protein